MNNVVVGWNIGHSSHDRTVRTMGWDIPASGFTGFAKKRVRPLIDRGFSRFTFHNPGGIGDDNQMRLDQMRELDVAHITGVNSGSWIEAMHMIREWGGKECIAYAGCPDLTPGLTVRQWSPAAYESFVADCIAPYLAAGNSIALDAIAMTKWNHPIHDIIDRLPCMVYGEGWPREDNPRLHQLGVWVKHDGWKKSLNNQRAASFKQVEGEVLVACGADMNAVEEVVKAGHTPIIGPGAVDTYLERFK